MSRIIRPASLLALVLLLVLASVTLAQTAATVQTASNATLGTILVDGAGKTLYFYTKDTAGVSNCTGACLQAWPPLTVASGATPTAGQGVTAKLGTITRSDGTLQVTANNLPLYYWAQDAAAGDTKGQGVGGVWFVSDPAGNMVKAAAAAAAAAGTPSATTAATTAATAAATTAATAAPTTAAATTAATAAPTTAATAAKPATLPTTGGSDVNWLLPLLAFVVVFIGAGVGLNLVRRAR
ncbi:MAG TPA: hypothetical protein VGA61_01410 [Anaerolineae bacterium]